MNLTPSIFSISSFLRSSGTRTSHMDCTDVACTFAAGQVAADLGDAVVEMTGEVEVEIVERRLERTGEERERD